MLHARLKLKAVTSADFLQQGKIQGEAGSVPTVRALPIFSSESLLLEPRDLGVFGAQRYHLRYRISVDFVHNICFYCSSAVLWVCWPRYGCQFDLCRGIWNPCRLGTCGLRTQALFICL